MSWEDAFGPLRTASELACAFMILYIVIAVFAVLNATGSVRNFGGRLGRAMSVCKLKIAELCREIE